MDKKINFFSDADTEALKEWRRKELRKPKNNPKVNRRIPQVLGSGGSRIYYGSPKTDFTEIGALLEPNNIVILWTGFKEASPGPTDPEVELACHWTSDTFTTADLVVVTEFYDGSRIVSCFPGGIPLI